MVGRQKKKKKTQRRGWKKQQKRQEKDGRMNRRKGSSIEKDVIVRKRWKGTAMEKSVTGYSDTGTAPPLPKEKKKKKK